MEEKIEVPRCKMEGKIEVPQFPELEFEEKRHIYTLHGMELPSVTKIMQPLSSYIYSRVDAKTLNAAADKGTIVHNACENYIKFGISSASISERAAQSLLKVDSKQEIGKTRAEIKERALKSLLKASILETARKNLKTIQTTIPTLTRMTHQATCRADSRRSMTIPNSRSEVCHV